MSIDLDTKLVKDVTIKDLLIGTKSELMNLINYIEIPDLEIKQLVKGQRYNIDENSILKSKMSLLINFKGAEDEVNVILTEIELSLPYIAEEDAGVWLGLSIQGEEPIKFFLASGIALYVSKICDSIIFDERSFWTINRENNFSSFSESIKLNNINEINELKNHNYNINDRLKIISKKFYDVLPKGNIS